MQALIREVIERRGEVDEAELVSFSAAAEYLGITINGLKTLAYRQGWTIVIDAGKLESFSNRSYLYWVDVGRNAELREDAKRHQSQAERVSGA